MKINIVTGATAPALDIGTIMAKLSKYKSCPNVDKGMCSPMVYDPISFQPRIGIKVFFHDNTESSVVLDANKINSTTESDDFIYDAIAKTLWLEKTLQQK